MIKLYQTPLEKLGDKYAAFRKMGTSSNPIFSFPTLEERAKLLIELNDLADADSIELSLWYSNFYYYVAFSLRN